MKETTNAPSPLVVMGVSGSGKTTIASLLATRLGYEFIDADDLHSESNRQKMASGHALSDADREPWLHRVGALMREESRRHGCVVACSALKRSYRDILRDYVPATFFVVLDGPIDVVRARLAARKVNLLAPSLLLTQYDTLEALQSDETGICVDLTLSPDAIVSRVLDALAPA